MLGLWALIAVSGLVAFHASKLPPIDQLAVPKRPPNIAILATTAFCSPIAATPAGAAVTLQELPPYLPKAFVAIEDRRFYRIWASIPIGIARAVFRNVHAAARMQGGSTLTQQLAKNLFLTQERTAFAQDPGGDPRALAGAQLQRRTRSSNCI